MNPIYTIGYGDRSLDDWAAVLNAHDIHYLIDIRSVPYAGHKPEFSGPSLAETLRSHGIRYVFMGDMLGAHPDDPECYDNGQVSYRRLEQMDFYRQGIDSLQKAFAQDLRIVLMDEAARPQHSHRSQLIGATLTTLGIPVLHIDENDELASQTEVMTRLRGAPPKIEAARELLQTIFGYDTFWPLQEQIIANVLARRDTLVVMPTGGGKSLCYQLPALLFKGLTVVISPLISLMQDQVEALRELGISAAYLNSTLDHAGYAATTAAVRTGEVKLLYVAPETDRKSTRLNSSHIPLSRMPSSA